MINKINLQHYDTVSEKKEYFQQLLNSVENKYNPDIATDFDESKNYIINYKENLNKSQLQAATLLHGPILIIAGAGSGKTTTLSYRVSFLLENGISPSAILLLTFTKKAAEEMLNKVKKLLPESFGAKGVCGGTFHSFAYSTLLDYSSYLNIDNLNIMSESDEKKLIKEIILEQKTKWLSELKMDVKTLASLLFTLFSKSVNCNTTIEKTISLGYLMFSGFVDEIEQVYNELQLYKTEHDLLNFDDILKRFYNTLCDNDKFTEILKNKFKYIIADEYQDTNILQKLILDKITNSSQNIMIVGDDTQSIYKFRGANVENILLFFETYPNATIIKLEKNYRSSQQILDFCNAIAHNAEIGYKKTLVPANAPSNKPVLTITETQADMAIDMAKQVKWLINTGTKPSEIAILTRFIKQTELIEIYLNAQNIPYKKYGGKKITDYEYVQDILAILKVINNVKDAPSWSRVLLCIPGVGAKSSDKVMQQIKKNNWHLDISLFEKKKYKENLNALFNLIKMARKKDEMELDSIFLYSKNLYFKFIKDNKKLAYVLKHAAQSHINSIQQAISRFTNLKHFLNTFGVEQEDNTNADKEIIVSTIHSAKGLEWENVFFAQISEGHLPSIFTLREENIHLRFDLLEEERRLFYVACSRAKERLMLYFYEKTMSNTGDRYILNKLSQFITELNGNLYDTRRI
jgi:DNA helicase II / ATP-dependent DNA helicase PcrA